MSSPASSPSFLSPNRVHTRIREGFLKTLSRTFHHRWLLGFLCLLSLVTGYFTARIYGTALYEASLYMIFAGDTKEGVTPEQMFLAALSEARNPVLIKRVIAEVDPQLSNRTFQRNFTVTAQAQPNMMLLQLKWSNAETARNLLNAFIAPYQKHLKQSQISTFDREGNPVVPSADSLAKLEAEIAKLRQKKREDLTTQGLTDFAGDVAAIKSAISSAETQVKNSEMKLVGMKTKYSEILRQLEDLKKYAAKEAEIREVEETTNGNVPANPQRQQRLRELIAEENAQNEIIKLDRVIMPESPRNTHSSPIIAQMLDKKLQLELEMLAVPDEIGHLRSEIDLQKAKLANLTGMEGRFVHLDQQIARREKEHRSIQAEFTRLSSQRSLAIPFGEASVTPFPVSSNRQTMFTTIFLSGSAISLLAVFLYELVMGIRLPSDMARSLRLPVRWIAANPNHAATDYRELCRVVRRGGFLAKTVLQIQPLTQDASAQTKTDDAVQGLAAAFAKRGEKVLVVDLCETNLEIAGLAELLVAPDESIDRFVQPGDASGVSRMSAGRQELTASQLTDPALCACLANIAETYSVILLHGHGLQAIQEVEALGLAAHGLVMVSDGDRTIEPAAREALVDLTAENLTAQVLLIV